MNERDVRMLLAAAMAYDNRKPGDAAVLAWMEAATRARWTFPSALEAIHQHYATSTEFLMPGHITARVRAAREEEALREAARALPPVDDPDAPARHQRIVRSILGEPDEQAERESTARRVGCGHCGAPPGRPCTTNGVRRATSHPSRIDAAQNFNDRSA